MIEFTYHNPTQIEFGKGKEQQIGSLIAARGIKKVLLCYGSERIKKDGLFAVIAKSLADNGIQHVELAGIVSNPLLSKVYEGVERAKANQVEAILSVGGGSALDSSKTIAVGALYDGDVWDFFMGKAIIQKALPVFSVMTLAATGSEMNSFAVVTNDETKQKYPIISPLIYPIVSVINPELTKSVPNNYLAYSAVDIIAHTIEGYFTSTHQPHFQSRLVEAIIQTVMETTEILLKNPDDYNARAEFAWAATQALNGVTTAGTANAGYPNHMIEHALSAICNVAHGAGLAVVIPAWMKWFHTRNEVQFKRFAEKIFGLNTPEEGIAALKAWFNKIGAPTSFAQAGIGEEMLEAIIDNAHQNSGHFGLGEVYTRPVITEILNNAK